MEIYRFFAVFRICSSFSCTKRGRLGKSNGFHDLPEDSASFDRKIENAYRVQMQAFAALSIIAWAGGDFWLGEKGFNFYGATCAMNPLRDRPRDRESTGTRKHRDRRRNRKGSESCEFALGSGEVKPDSNLDTNLRISEYPHQSAWMGESQRHSRVHLCWRMSPAHHPVALEGDCVPPVFPTPFRCTR